MKEKWEILIIEDHLEIACWILSRLKMKNRYINWSDSYNEGIAYLKKNEPDIIILDLQLKDGNGFDILKSVKEINSSILVYIFSVNSAMRTPCLRNGADGFFDKNGEGNLLVETVVDYVNNHS